MLVYYRHHVFVRDEDAGKLPTSLRFVDRRDGVSRFIRIYTRKLTRVAVARMREEVEQQTQIRKRIDLAIAGVRPAQPKAEQQQQPTQPVQVKQPKGKRGAPPAYNREAIHAVAEDVRKSGDYDNKKQTAFFAAVRVECAKRKPVINTPPANDDRTMRRYIGDLAPKR
jgi:hypothetical protein